MSGYGPERYHFDGQSLPSLIRQVRQSQLDGVKDQTPVYRYPKADRSRLRAKECVRRFMQIMRRAS